MKFTTEVWSLPMREGDQPVSRQTYDDIKQVHHMLKYFGAVPGASNQRYLQFFFTETHSYIISCQH